MDTPKIMGGRLQAFADLADGVIPKAALKDLGEKARGIAAAASAASGGVKAPASQFKYKPAVSTSKGTAEARVVGFGFAVLDEYGPYKHPQGWYIGPRKGGYGQTGLGRSLKENAKGRRVAESTFQRRATAAARYFGYSKVILGNKASGFAAAHVNPTPKQVFAAHPFQDEVTVALGPLGEAEMNKAAVVNLAKVGLG